MAATGLQVNWADVAFGDTDIVRVTNVSFNLAGQNEGFAGDGDIFDSCVVTMSVKPTATITSGDAAVLMGIAPGTEASLTATHKDAKGQTAGDIVYVLAHATAAGGETSGAHAAYGSASHTFMGYAPDGQTNPLSFTRV